MITKYRRKLTNKQRVNIINRYGKGDISLSELAKKYKVTKTTIWKVVNKSEGKITIDEIREELHKTSMLLKKNIKNIEHIRKEIKEDKLSNEELVDYNKIINLLSSFNGLVKELEVFGRINKSSDMKELIDFVNKNKK